MAYAAGVPIVGVYQNQAKISSALSFITEDFIAYADTPDLIAKLEASPLLSQNTSLPH